MDRPTLDWLACHDDMENDGWIEDSDRGSIRSPDSPEPTLTLRYFRAAGEHHPADEIFGKGIDRAAAIVDAWQQTESQLERRLAETGYKCVSIRAQPIGAENLVCSQNRAATVGESLGDFEVTGQTRREALSKALRRVSG